MTHSQASHRLCWLLLGLSIFACAVNVGRSVRDCDRSGGTDLRVRVVGARALVLGRNPYTLSQDDSDDARLADPDRGRLNRCTYPPTLLSFYAPFSGLPYPTQRLLWMILEWTALLVALGLLASLVQTGFARCCFVAAGLGMIAGSQFWRLHVERGQYYVFVLLFLSLGLWTLRHRRSAVAAGVWFGLAACLRPPVLCFLFPFVWSRHRGALLAGAVTVTCGVLLSLTWGGVGYWQDFVALSRSWEQSILNGTFAEASRRGRIEEVDGYQPEILSIPAPNLSIASVLHDKLPESLRQRPEVPAAAIKLVWCGVTVLLMSAWLRRRRGRPVNTESVLMCGITVVLLTDYFLPIRIAYADVLFLVPLALLMPLLQQPQNRVLSLVLLLAFLPALLPLPGLPWQYWYITTALRSAAVICVSMRLLLEPTSTEVGGEPGEIHCHAQSRERDTLT